MNYYLSKEDYTSYDSFGESTELSASGTDIAVSNTYGGFGSSIEEKASYDATISKTYKELEKANGALDPIHKYGDVIRDGVVVSKETGMSYKEGSALETLTDALINPFIEASEEFRDLGADGGIYATNATAATISRMIKNHVSQIYDESVVNPAMYQPIVATTGAIISKQHITAYVNDIMQSKTVDKPIYTKKIKQDYLVTGYGTTRQRTKYPQVLFDNARYNALIEQAKGLKIKDTPVALTNGYIHEYDVITNLTDAVVPDNEYISLNFAVSKLVDVYGHEHIYTSWFNPQTHALDEPTIDKIFTASYKANAAEVAAYNTANSAHPIVLNDVITITSKISGSLNPIKHTVTIQATNDVIASVIFEGYLSNENNSRTISVESDQRYLQWSIEDGPRLQRSFFIESVRDSKALSGIDLWKETYDLIQLGLADIEDNTGIQFLDAMLTRYDSITVSAEDMLDYSPFVTKTTFDCKPAAMVTTALPSEYVEKELKARIDRLVLATADSCKLEKLSFVMFGNSRYMHLLKDQIKWVVQAGDTYGGVRMTYSYGIMNSGDIRIQVVSSRKIDINNTYGDKLRLLPISMDPSILTWEMLKYDSYILNSPKEAGYLNNKLPGGAYSVVTASTRVKPIALQGFQSYVTLSNKSDYVL